MNKGRVDAELLCFATQSVQIAVLWLHEPFSKGTCSPVLSCDSDCVLQVIAASNACGLNVRISRKNRFFPRQVGLRARQVR